MKALHAHAFAHLFATPRGRDAGRRRDDVGERTDGRVLVDASRAPVRPTLDNLR